jgi:hypothetical protein
MKAEGLSKEEIENELAVMELAEAFVLHASMKSLDRARSMYESILSREYEPFSPPTRFHFTLSPIFSSRIFAFLSCLSFTRARM